MNIDLETVHEFKPESVFNPLTKEELKNKPDQLYALGDLDLLTKSPKVSIVGSRKVSQEGIKRARFITKELVKHNIIIVSGMALGVDTIAHTTTIEQGGKTIAVLGTPLDKPYPKENMDLFSRLSINHLVLSQFPVGYPTTPKNFPIRNRTMALITDATVIIEAGEKSGTLHQGWEALRLGRLLFLLESVADDPKLSWPKEMINYGAQVLTRDNLQDMIDHLPRFTVREEIVF